MVGLVPFPHRCKFVHIDNANIDSVIGSNARDISVERTGLLFFVVIVLPSIYVGRSRFTFDAIFSKDYKTDHCITTVVHLEKLE